MHLSRNGCIVCLRQREKTIFWRKNFMKFVTYLLIVAVVAYVGAFDFVVRKGHSALWEEYQASVPGCTTPKIEHFSTGCVRSSQLDAAMWNREPSNRTYSQIKNQHDEANRKNGVCHVGDWYVSNGLVHTAWIYYPCTWRSTWTLFAGT